MNRNLLAMRHLDVDDIQYLLAMAQMHKDNVEAGEYPAPPAVRRSVGLLFFENSTRTRVSFEKACHYLGYQPVNFSGDGSSMSKGETLRDTIFTLKHERLDALVMRHRSSGAANLAAEYFGGPTVNAGDGQHEHPTQALSDALTVLSRKGQIEGLNVAIVGDILHSRVARSDAWIFSKLGAHVRFVGPNTLVPSVMSGLPGSMHYDLKEGLDGADVVICLRLQRERMRGPHLSSSREYTKLYQVNRAALRVANPEAIVMHPGPMNRGVELDDATADGPQCAVLEQVTNGIFVRMAALQWALGDDRGDA